MQKIPVKPNTLVQMLGMQMKLLEHYIQIEGLPEYPVDLSERKNQKVMKDFIGRFIEELSEAYDSMVEAYVLVSSNQPGAAQRALVDYNVEIADAWHFFLEILIYSGIGKEELEEMVQKYAEDNPQFAGLIKPDQPFRFFLTVADYYNQREGLKVVQNKADRFIIASEQDWVNDFRLAGGRRISEGLLKDHAALLWTLTHSAKKLSNTLKKRDWVQREEVVLNQTKYNQLLIELVLSMALYMDFIGIGEIQIVNMYNYKHQINLEQRIKGGY